MKMTKIADLKDAPDWLKRARVRDEDVEIVNGVVIWKDGTWEGGLWEGGTWEDGIWEYGAWEGGTWEGGTWKGGTWKGGIWRGGTWKGGTWLGGLWRGGTWKGGAWLGGLWLYGTWKAGTWEGGIWKGGTWKGGTWKGGTWKGGTWEDGYQAPARCKWSVLITPDYQVKVGCEVKTIEEWEAWLDSGEEFETPRSSPAFVDIHRSLVGALAVARFERKRRADISTGP
jgi:hypothetical protein